MIDANDSVLDANICEGLMAEYLRRNEICEVCGIHGSMEGVKQARARLHGCDIVYAGAGDIPWPDDTFNVAFMRAEQTERDDIERRLCELHRVLKEGGQLVLGCASAIGRIVMSRLDYDAPCCPDMHELSDSLAKLGFTDITRQHAGLMADVLVAWKRKPAAERAIQQQ